MGGKGSGGVRSPLGGRPTLRLRRVSVRLSRRASESLTEFQRRTGANQSDAINQILEGAAAPRAVAGGVRRYAIE